MKQLPRSPKQIGTLYLTLEGAGTFCGGSFHGAVYMDFLMNHLHDYALANSVNVVFFCTLFLAEIPTGAYADTFGRKASYVLASLLWSLGLIVYGLSDSFIGFATAEAILAIGSTCVSGAFEAWLVDSLAHSGMKGTELEYYKTKLFTRESTVSRISGIFGSIVGAWIYSLDPASCWILSGILMLGHAIAAKYLMREDYFVRKTHAIRAHWIELKEKMRTSIALTRKDPTIRTLALLSAMQSFACAGTNMLWQPFFKEHLPVFWLGCLLSLWMICGAVGAEIALRYKATERGSMLTLRDSMICTGILVAASALCPFPFSLIVFTLSQIPRGVLEPIFTTALHSAITDSETRATTASCARMTRHIGGAIGLGLSGLSAKYSGIPATWIWSGLSLVVGAWWLCGRYQRLQK